MNEQYKEEKAKLTAIEKAVLDGTPNEAAKLYREFTNPLLTARILGIAGRFRGLDMVKALVENGASFGYEVKKNYDLYYNFSDHYSMLLPDFFILFLLKGIDRIKGYFAPSRKMNALVDKEGRPLAPVCEEERIKVIEYLCGQEERVCICPGDYLYFAILTEEKNIVDALKGRGIGLSDEKIKMLTEGGGYDNDKWTMYYYFLGELNDDALLYVISALCMEIGEEKKLHFTEKLWKVNNQKFLLPMFFVVVLEHFNQSKMNKKKILEEVIDNESVSCLKIAEDYGWLKEPRRRDELIEYASKNGRVESAAWLLDFKNRTADFVAEREKAEKKLMRELNMAPDSVTALKRIWSYEKREDGTLIITNYKGKEVEVTVPEKIGKNIVTAIGYGAFTGNAMFSPNAKQAQIIQHREITKITLPKTIQRIGIYAFRNMPSLKEMIIPDGVEELDIGAFWACDSLQNLTISGTVKSIGACICFQCRRLERVHICEGVLEIGESAFLNCSNLEEVRLPKSVQSIITASSSSFNNEAEVFSGCPKLTIYCPEGSKAETYCKEKGFRFKNSED